MADALETASGAAFAREIIDALEFELVRFRHRVLHDHGIELDRARAAMVLLGKLVGAGVPWIARPDSDPARIHEAFSTIVGRDAELAPTLKREVAAFFAATADVEVAADDGSTAPAALLRKSGSDPALWWWAAQHADAARCWLATGSDIDRIVQVALAFGVSADVVARALAHVMSMILARVKTRATHRRDDLVAALAALQEHGARALEDDELVAVVTKLAFELMWKKEAKVDAFAEVAVHAFQLVEALKTWRGVADLERFGALATRIEKLTAARGMQVAAIVRKEIEPAVADAIQRL